MSASEGEPILPLSKEDVAQRTLDAAIKLFLTGGDPVAVHLLTFSALHVLRGVAVARGLSTPYTEHHNRPDMGKAFRDRLDEAYVFMKHAMRDPDAVLEVFRPSANFLVLAVAAGEFFAVYRRETHEMPALAEWLATQYPDLYHFPPHPQVRLR